MKTSEKKELLPVEEQDKELCKEELAQIAGGTGDNLPASNGEDRSAMENTAADMGGMGGYGNRGKRGS